MEKDSGLLAAEKEESLSITGTKAESRTDKAADEAADGKIIADEDILEGHVGWTACEYMVIPIIYS